MKIRLITLPNIVTLCNLLCGSAATVYALVLSDLQTAFWLVVAAAVFDFLDGFTARLTGSFSPVGKELDSLSDMVSFGVAPSSVLFVMYQTQSGAFAGGGIDPWGFAVFILAAFSALRLAKFNIDESQRYEFEGLPTPPAALLVCSAGYLFADGVYAVRPYYILLSALCLSYFLVSPVRMFALKFHGYGLHEPQNLLRYVFLLVSLAALVLFRIGAVPFIVMAYILVSLVRNIVMSLRRG